MKLGGFVSAYPMPPIIICLIVITLLTVTDEASSSMAKNKTGCQEKCGNITIPYPFGIGKGCYLDEEFEVTCNRSSNSATLQVDYYRYPVLEISMDYVRATSKAMPTCYNGSGIASPFWGFGLSQHFSFSHVHNKFVAVGCDIFAYFADWNKYNHSSTYIVGCASFCDNLLPNETSTGHYCQTPLPRNINSLLFSYASYSMNTDERHWIENPFGFAFIAENNFSKFDHFNISNNSVLYANISSCDYVEGYDVPVVLDWKVGNMSCSEATKRKDYACRLNTKCVDFVGGRGYKCDCKRGYQGNPYHSDGCQDIDECKASKNSTCKNPTICVNTEGSYYCTCPSGYHGNNTEDGFGCKVNNFSPRIVFLGVGISVVVISLIPIGFLLYRTFERRKKKITKQKFFKRNGGLLLQQQISPSKGNVTKTKLFTAEELEKATDNFNRNRVLGKGGLGTVYKGMVQDGSIVAVKKSNKINENQVGQFINEVIILSQIDHRNIVKLLGCCLETEVPLLVYEYVSNGTLSDHLHNMHRVSTISWGTRLQIAAEVAGALAYLHSYASTTIFHRDIKSCNILLDENNRAVVSDFGLSRSVPIDKTHLTTSVGGTFGYLDPEYFRSGQLTDKSDVYSFGVVLAELLTGVKAVSSDASELGLVMHFQSSMKQNRLFEIVETLVMEEGLEEDILFVAKLAKRCLKRNAKKRPSMKELAANLDRLTAKQIQPSHEQIRQDSHLSESERLYSYSTDGITEDSLETSHDSSNHTK